MAKNSSQYEAKGLEKGREEENLEIVKSMLADKQPIEKIMKWTGLRKETIGRIARELSTRQVE